MDEDPAPTLDLPIVGASGLAVVQRAQILDDATDRLVDAGHHVARLDAATWESRDAMYDGFAAALGFPDHFGRNLDALHDCLEDVTHGAYGGRAGATGLVVVVTGLNAFAERFPDLARALVDVLTATTRSAVHGESTLVLLETDHLHPHRKQS
ncbi:hypothetical protein GCM10023113_20910 [Cellulomonas oligotrophica]|uniref:Barstar (barnase inhibitor) domain-containing protein n=1 Tax=Cellulomonas oligotrophica TaxID=931536 RepID=A0ABQ4DEW1_9CELL|nr:hypothetical protein Col01nite_34270 [Cellulomonas oligotrophica]